MKKLAIVCCAALLALLSCQKESLDIMETPQTPEIPAAKISFNLDATHPDGAGTKAVKTGWETGDVIFVFFSNSKAPGYLEMKWDGSQWLFTEKNNLLLADGDTGTMWAVHQPFGNDNEVTADENGNWAFRDIHYTYCLDGSLPYTVSDGGQVSGTFDMRIPWGYVQFFLDDSAASSTRQMELRERNICPMGVLHVAPAYGAFLNVEAGGAPMPGYVYDKESKAAGEQKGWLFSGVLAPAARGNGTDYHFTLVDGGWEGNYYRKSFLNKSYYTGDVERRALKLPSIGSWTSIDDYKPIDLGCNYIDRTNGIFKRIYWSSRNLGASSDFPAANTNSARLATWGDYYAWGETEPYYEAGTAYEAYPRWNSGKEAGYAWASYRWTIDGGNTFTKYIPGGDVTLQADDDAATAALQGAWRMPTVKEWDLLSNGDNFEWAWDNNNKGMTFTSKIPGFEGRSIFLPAAGFRNGTSRNYFGNEIRYWSSSLGDEAADAQEVEVNIYGITTSFVQSRFYGYSIRPITE